MSGWMWASLLNASAYQAKSNLGKLQHCLLSLKAKEVQIKNSYFGVENWLILCLFSLASQSTSVTNPDLNTLVAAVTFGKGWLPAMFNIQCMLFALFAQLCYYQIKKNEEWTKCWQVIVLKTIPFNCTLILRTSIYKAMNYAGRIFSKLYNFHVLTTNHIMTKLTYQNQDQRHKYHHLMMTLHLTLKLTTTQVVETSVTSNSLSKDYLHPDDHAKHITHTPGVKPFTKLCNPDKGSAANFSILFSPWLLIIWKEKINVAPDHC